GKLAILVQAIEDGPEAVYTESHVKKLQLLLKKEANTGILHRFITQKPVKSQVVQVVLQHPQSNSFVRNGGQMSFSAHKIVHKARLNLLVCNANTWDATSTKQCRRCVKEKETQMHILQVCTYNKSGLITERHNAVHNKVSELIKKGSKRNWKLVDDSVIAGPSVKRPDIMLRSPDGKEIILADVTCPYECGLQGMQRAWDYKVEKYTKAYKYLEARGMKVTVLPIVVGSLGTWWKPTTNSLLQLGIDRKTINEWIPKLCAATAEYSKNIYWRHIKGDRYQSIPMKFGLDKPPGNSWKRGKRRKPPKPAKN
ncbi:hypothetical protein CRE_21624, partial [Caenorhabditis remanei]